MADCLDDAEFWLPPQFLNEEDFLMGRKSFNPKATAGDGFGLGRLGCGSRSGLSSPVESLLGSLEAESDEEDLLADLTRKMGYSNLDDGFKTADSKVRLLSGSPQSTLCPGWDMLCEAAGEVARLRLSEQLYALSRSRAGGEGLYGAAGRRSPVPVPLKTHVTDGGLNYSHHHHSLSHQQLVANQIQQLKQQQAIMKQQRAGANWGMNTKPANGPYHAAQTGGRKPDSAVRPLVAPAASPWPSVQQQQQQSGGGMRAVILGAPPSGKRECAGTGVFLPRRAGSQPEPRKKPACATVLLPDKVIRALNLNLENVGAQPHLQHRFNGCLAPENDCVWNLGINGIAAQQNRTSRPQAVPNHEIRLPQEWTY
ncbi:uncharacterized protein LOC116208608 [Punica granatum]|uniref:Uncharacterized protein LOC116208608 n=1 Tax=Punica granatum TaxID=22663 RepID=A0A6P8DUE2_PUNGR|nr:uncharacterized protein LOC116208608 [Punica granatum]